LAEILFASHCASVSSKPVNQTVGALNANYSKTHRKLRTSNFTYRYVFPGTVRTGSLKIYGKGCVDSVTWPELFKITWRRHSHSRESTVVHLILHTFDNTVGLTHAHGVQYQ